MVQKELYVVSFCAEVLMLQDMMQYNGAYGCPYCLHPGERLKTGERGHFILKVSQIRMRGKEHI